MNSTPRTAFILQIHKNPEQVNMFINQLISDGQADVYVHIDKRNYEELHKRIIRSPNVIILKDPIKVEWGDISQIDATILLMKRVLSSKYEYDFICLRSGQDLLVKNELKEYLKVNKNKIFMTVDRHSNKSLIANMNIRWPKITRKRYNNLHPFRAYRTLISRLYQRGINLFPNSNLLPEEYSFYKGSQWFCMPLEVIKYIIEFLEQNKWYYDFFNNTLVPDEWFFQTLIMNSKYKTGVVNNNLTYLRWGETLQTRYNPVILTMEDKNVIEGSENYFARKFDEKVDRSIIDYFIANVIFNEIKIEQNKSSLSSL